MGETMSHRWAARAAIAGTCLIAFGAFWLSFTALADLAARSGIAAGQAWAWPLIVDGIIVVATVSVVALAGQKTAWYPWMLLAGGALISVTANAVHAVVSADADVPDVLAAAVAAVPPVVLLAITHLTVILTRKPADITTGAPRLDVHQMPVPNSAPELLSAEGLPALAPVAAVEGVPEPVESVVDRRERAVGLREAGWSNKQIARELGVHASTVGRWFSREHPPIDTESEATGDES
ncbi:MAG: excisionase [Micrococcales bacterium 73-15]|nr:MAG: excisionase [Micrococcales bacterium 73-15]